MATCTLTISPTAFLQQMPYQVDTGLVALPMVGIANVLCGILSHPIPKFNIQSPSFRPISSSTSIQSSFLCQI